MDMASVILLKEIAYKGGRQKKYNYLHNIGDFQSQFIILDSRYSSISGSRRNLAFLHSYARVIDLKEMM